MRRRRIRGFAVVVAAAAGAILGVALLASPVAYADDVATLPVPPFDPTNVTAANSPLGPPALSGGVPTNLEDSTIFDGQQLQWDAAYTLPDGSYETHSVGDTYGEPENFFEQDSDVVTASEGVAPAVGTEWDQSIFWLPSGGYSLELYVNASMTTSAGTVDVFTPENLPFLSAWSNEFYNGPAGTFDDLVSYNGATVIPIIDMPAETSSAAAADFSTLWSDLVGTL
jgi:hypothetical protein